MLSSDSLPSQTNVIFLSSGIIVTDGGVGADGVLKSLLNTVIAFSAVFSNSSLLSATIIVITIFCVSPEAILKSPLDIV